MRRLRSRVTAAGVLVVVVVGFLGWNLWEKHQWAVTIVYVSNATDTAYLVRVTDGTSGRGLGTVRLDPGTQTLVVQHVLHVWWREPSIPEQAAGGTDGVRLELLGDQCAALAVVTASGVDSNSFTLDPVDGLSRGWPDRALPVRSRTVVADPCGDLPAPPAAVVANLHVVPVLLEGRVRVDACSIRTVLPGEATRTLSAAEADGAEPVGVPSLALQKGRWPLESRSVVLGLDVIDQHAAAIADPSMLDSCKRALEAASAR